jgi:hypothetical protein
VGFHKLALVVVVISFHACCDLSREERVQVLLPAPPAPWQAAFPRLGFRIVTQGVSTGVQEAEVDDWRDPVEVSCHRSVNSPVLAYPRDSAAPDSAVSTPGRLRPAGGFYPLSLRAFQSREVLELTWEDGPGALVMSKVAAQGLDPSLFNVTKLSHYLLQNRDPWDVDLDAVAQKILKGELTAWDIDTLPCRDAEVEPGPGTWFLESPFSSSFEAIKGRVRLPEVSIGSHRLFSLRGKSWSVQVGLAEVVMIPAP